MHITHRVCVWLGQTTFSIVLCRLLGKKIVFSFYMTVSPIFFIVRGRKGGFGKGSGGYGKGGNIYGFRGEEDPTKTNWTLNLLKTQEPAAH